MSKKVLFIVLGVILFLLVGSSIYVNFMAKSGVVVSYLLFAQIVLGLVAVITTLFASNKAFISKKSHEVLLIAFLESLFVLGLVILNTVVGYRDVTNIVNYGEYMEYVSMYMNIYLFLGFSLILGAFSLNFYIKSLLNNK